ncbi:MAG: transposase [Actinomycetota bacterium]|nr:transposase [Actinomycetota bacterium]
MIPTRVREGVHALDEIFALRDRDSELTIAEHTTDTAGFTDLLFGAYDVVGLLFCPRIRDLADQRLWLPRDSTPPKLVALLVANRVLVEPILACWDDLLRLGASIHEGEVLPSLLLTKLQAFPRQNALARALQVDAHRLLIRGTPVRLPHEEFVIPRQLMDNAGHLVTHVSYGQCVGFRGSTILRPRFDAWLAHGFTSRAGGRRGQLRAIHLHVTSCDHGRNIHLPRSGDRDPRDDCDDYR